MRKVFSILLLLFCMATRGQLYFELLYPDSMLQEQLQRAKTPAEQLRAAGVLALHYAEKFNDSLAALYLQQVHTLAAASADKTLKADALLWEAKCRIGSQFSNKSAQAIDKANQLLHYAEQTNLPLYQIAAHLTLSDIHMRNSKYPLSEQYGLKAKQLFENWKVDSSKKDSLRIEVYWRLAYAYIRKSEGVNAARYLLAIQDYAEQNRNEVVKLQAMKQLQIGYGEWDTQRQKAIAWGKKLYDYFKGKRQPEKLYVTAYDIAFDCALLTNKDSAYKQMGMQYMREAEHLSDSLGAYNRYTMFASNFKTQLGLQSREQAIQDVFTNYNNHLFLPPAYSDLNKARIYLYWKENLDSAGYYFSKVKKEDVNAVVQKILYKIHLANYYIKKKQYSRAIDLLLEIKKRREEGGSNTQEALLRLSEAYESKGDYKQALAYANQYHHLKDSLQELDTKQDIALMEVQKERDLQTAAFKEEQKTAQEEQARITYRNKVRLYGLAGGLILLLLIAALLWRNNQQKQKANTLLKNEKEKVESTLQQLKATQAQLIQSEKMASLGELTAGIAHEIQNPLNFVNNFSETNVELVDELEHEMGNGNLAEAKQIAADVKQNNVKINQHGKRADSIVKSMLEHSRTSKGEKQPTDLNTLADEYLRLAYHGFRAKYKSFNANVETNFDKGVGTINIVPQEIGRVLLNLFNNAFYAVHEQMKKLGASYEPTISISTKQLQDKIEIRVQDNGMGISKSVQEKIFQPFFTTKPTGEGTGLGLSLSYDIIKAHGGEINVQTKEGQYTVFIVQLPFH